MLENLNEHIITPVSALFGKARSGGFSQNISSLIKPEKIVANSAGKRSVLYSTVPGYDELLESSNSFMREFLLDELKIRSRETVEEDEVFSVLKGKSLYIDYDNRCDSRLYSVSVCGKEKTSFSNDVSMVKEIVISFRDNVLNTIAIYVKDYKSQNIWKYTVESGDIKIEESLTKYYETYSGENMLSYSYELNFHKEVNVNGREAKVVFDPLILFDLTPKQRPDIVSENLIAGQGTELETPLENIILKAFQINSNSMFKYTDLENAKIFVENDATLIIDPSGYFEYKALEGSRGLSISQGMDKSSYDIYASTTLAVDFVAALCNSISGDLLSRMRISSDVVENTGKQGNYLITFDLYIDGIPVLQYNEETQKTDHTIVMELDNGYLKSYRQYLKTYHFSGNSSGISPVINAVDELISFASEEKLPLRVKRIGVCYFDTQAETLPQKWEVDVDGVTEAITIG